MVNNKTISFFSRPRISFIKNVISLTILGVFFYACSTSNKEMDLNESLEVYYFRGLVDANFPCNGNVEISFTDDEGFIKIPKKEYLQIMKYIDELQKTGDIGDPYGLCLQCIVKDTERQIKISINQFHKMAIGNEIVYTNDSLIYALRKYSGFYNYYNKEDVVKFCPELAIFGIPDNYQDLSASLDSKHHLFAKIRILAE